MKFRWAVILAVVGAWVGAARADWVLNSVDLSVQDHVTVNEWSLKDGLSYTNAEGKVVTAQSRELIELVSDRWTADRPLTAPAGRWQLVLRNGDVLEGDPAGMRGQSILFRLAEMRGGGEEAPATAPATGPATMPATMPGAAKLTSEPLEVPLKVVASLRLRGAPPSNKPVPADRDVVRLKNNDYSEGVFVEMDEETVKMQGDLGTTDVPLSSVLQLSLGGVAAGRGIPALGVRITFASGSVLTTSGFEWRLTNVSFADPAGRMRKITADRIARVEVLGGRVVWLTELDPAKDEQTSLFGTSWPTMRNKNVLGGPLKMAKATYGRGLGVHTRSVLTYELDGTFTTLTLRAGLDDSAAGYGAADLAVVLDGKTLWEGKGMKAGQVSEGLKLTITGGRKLELRAEPADRLDVQGRVNWVEPALLRP